MVIWLLQTGEPLPIHKGIRKLRTALLAEKLLLRNHSIFWWASTFEHQRKVMLCNKDRDFHISPKFTIKALRGCGYRKNISIIRYLDHWIVAHKFRVRSRKCRPPDIIIASMPCHQLAYEAVRYAREFHVPVLVDIRDLWPDIFLNDILSCLQWAGKLALTRDFAKLRYLLSKADGRIAVSDGYLRWGLDRGARQAGKWDRVFFLGQNASHNSMETPELENIDFPAWLKERENHNLIIYLGTFGVSYELKLILQAARKMLEVGRTDACFVLAGTGEQGQSIHREALSLQNVVLPGWINEREIRGLLHKGCVGLVPYTKGAPQSIPNKPFEYLSAGLPLISSLEGEMANLVKNYHLGLNYRAGDLTDLCRCIETVLDHPALHKEMSGNALKFFREHCDANKIYTDYAEHIERVVKARQLIRIN